MTPSATVTEPAGHRTEIRQQWSAALTWVAGIVWPGAVVIETRGGRLPPGSHGVARFIPVTLPRQRLILAPEAPPAATARAVGHFWQGSSVAGSLGRGVAKGVARSGLLAAASSRRIQIALPAGSDRGEDVPAAVASALGWSGTLTAVSTPLHPRAHHKPILMFMTTTGAVLGFAKIGWNDHTRREVLREAEFLAKLEGRQFDALNIPAPLHATRVDDRDVLVVSALPAGGRAPASSLETVGAAAEVANLFGTYPARLPDSAFLARILDRLQHIPGPEAEVIRRAAMQRATATSDIALKFGAWHGDWRPQNMSRGNGALDVWDWERAAGDVPIGFDILHWEFQAAYWSEGSSVAEAVATCGQRAVQVLPRLGVTADIPLLIDLYLLELVSMLLADHRGLPAGDALRRQSHAVLTFLAESLPAGG